MSQGGLGIWKISPVFKGVGYATTIMAFWLNSYYVVVLAWAIYYFYQSFSTVLPWSTCSNAWNTPNCIKVTETINSSVSLNMTMTSTDEFWR